MRRLYHYFLFSVFNALVSETEECGDFAETSLGLFPKLCLSLVLLHRSFVVHDNAAVLQVGSSK